MNLLKRLFRVRKKDNKMQIYLTSVSVRPEITRVLLEQIADALEHQLTVHVASLWQTAPCRVVVASSPESIPNEAGICPLVVYDNPDQAGVLGWHTYDAATGRMPGTAFLDPILENGGTLLKGASSLSATLSHEACEAFCNPYVNDYAFVDESTLEPKEVSDRVEGDVYEIGGVTVSNFLGPRAFRDGPGPYDRMGLLKSPWEVRPGGYCERFNIKTGKMETHWGSLIPTWKRELKSRKRELGLSRLSQYVMAAR